VWHEWQENGERRPFCHSWRDDNARIISAMNLFLILLLVLSIYAALEPQRRRSAGQPRFPLGRSGKADRDEARRLADLRFIDGGGSRA
jgi:hypothetical protein